MININIYTPQEFNENVEYTKDIALGEPTLALLSSNIQVCVGGKWINFIQELVVKAHVDEPVAEICVTVVDPSILKTAEAEDYMRKQLRFMHDMGVKVKIIPIPSSSTVKDEDTDKTE